MAGPALAQEGALATWAATAPPIAVTLPAATTLGNVVAIAVGYTSNNGTTATILPTGFGVTTWAEAVANDVNLNSEVHIFWGVVDGTPAASGAVGWTGGNPYGYAKAVEIAGVSGVHKTSGRAGLSNATRNTANIVQTIASSFLFAAITSANTAAPTSGPAGGYTALTGGAATAGRGDFLYQITSAAATYNGSYTYAAAAVYSSAHVAFIGAAPGAVLAGSIAGVATVTASGMVTGPPAVLAGSIAGVATVTASGLYLSAVLAGSIAGVATVTASGLYLSAVLAGSIAGVATVTASLSALAGLAGSSAGAATVGATLTVHAGLAGSVTGAATVTASLTAVNRAALAGSSAGRATVGASLRTAAGLAGSSAGLATVGASLTAAPAGPLAVAIEFRGRVWHTSDGSVGSQPGWTSITCDVYGLGWNRGGGAYRGVYGIPDAASADLFLYDWNRDLDPSNTAGAYYPAFSVGAELRVTISGVVAFWGRINDIGHELMPPPVAGTTAVPVAKLSATDPMGGLSDFDCTGIIFGSSRTSDRIQEILDTAGVAGSVWPGGYAINAANAVNTDAWSAIVELNQNEWGSLEWLPGGILRSNVRANVWPATPPAPVIELGCQSGALLPIYKATRDVNRNTIRNEATAEIPADAGDSVFDSRSTSIDLYGARPVTNTALQFQFGYDRTAWSTTLLDRMSWPLESWTLELRPGRTDHVVALEALKLFVDRAHVVIDHYGPLIDRSMRVVGIAWAIDSDARAVVELTLGYDVGAPAHVTP